MNPIFPEGAVELIMAIAWIGLSIAIAVIASNKGRSGFKWFLFSLFLSPIIAGLFLLLAGEATTNKSKCPVCAKYIQIEAVKCRFCGAGLEPPPSPPSLSDKVSETTFRVLSAFSKEPLKMPEKEKETRGIKETRETKKEKNIRNLIILVVLLIVWALINYFKKK